MIGVKVLDDLLRRMLSTGVMVLDVEQNGAHILMRLPGAMRPSSAPPVIISTTAIGIFRSAHPRRPLQSSKPDDGVVAGQAVGYLQVGQVLTAIIAPADGTIADITVRDGEVLGYGAPVMTIKRRG